LLLEQPALLLLLLLLLHLGCKISARAIFRLLLFSCPVICRFSQPGHELTVDASAICRSKVVHALHRQRQH
jgi:hypothetical protein